MADTRTEFSGRVGGRDHRSRILAVAIAGSLLLVGHAAVADQFHQIDGATELSGSNLRISDTAGNSLACESRGDAIAGHGFIRNNGGSVSFDADQELTVAASSAPAGVTVATTSVQLPGDWRVTTGPPREVRFDFETTVSEDVPNGTHTVVLRADGQAGGVPAFLTGTFSVMVDCPVDAVDVTPPLVLISLDPASPDGNDGWYVSQVDVSVSATDDESDVVGPDYRTSADNGANWSDWTLL